MMSIEIPQMLQNDPFIIKNIKGCHIYGLDPFDTKHGAETAVKFSILRVAM